MSERGLTPHQQELNYMGQLESKVYRLTTKLATAEQERDALAARVKELEGQLSTLTGYTTTCQTINLDGWLERLLEHINRSCEVLHDPDRFKSIKCANKMHFKIDTEPQK